MLAMLFFGTCNTLVMKWQDQIEVADPIINEDGKKEKQLFNHPFFQCANMFVGEFMCLFVFFAKTRFNKSSSDQAIPLSPGGQVAETTKLKTKINPIYLAVPAMCDICGSTLMFVALTQCAASIYQMMRGIIVLVTAILSILFLGRKQYCHHWSSLFSIVAGVAIVGLVGIIMTNK